MAVVELPERSAGLGPEPEGTRAPVTRARHLPSYVYSSPEVFEREKENIFMKDWLCVARVEELEEPGDFMTHDVMGDPIVVCRNEDGELNAFSNLCRHRGTEVAQGSGNTKEFVCPYHGWLYDLKGYLLGAPFMKESELLEIGKCRLKPLGIGTWAGWVFVNFDEDAEPLADFLARFDEDFAYLRQEGLRMADKLSFEIDCNWKIVGENTTDFYHVSVVHTGTFGEVTLPDFPVQFSPRGGFKVEYRARPHTFSGKPIFGKMPAIADQPDNYAIAGYLAPNLHLFGRIENMRPAIYWPISENRSKLVFYVLFPEEWFDRPDFADGVKEYNAFYNQVAVEDIPMLEALQRSMRASRFEPGPMSIQEEIILHGINYRLDRTFDTA